VDRVAIGGEGHSVEHNYHLFLIPLLKHRHDMSDESVPLYGRAREIRHLSMASVRDVFVRRVSVRHASRSRRRRRRCHIGGKPRLYKIVVSPSKRLKSIKTVHALTFQQPSHVLLRGTHTLSSLHSAPMGAENLLSLSSVGGEWAPRQVSGHVRVGLHIPWGRRTRKTNK